jgi:putative addiction module component (TIGR02574 family)
MSAEPSHLLTSALALPDRERAHLAASLIESLEKAVDEEVEAAWRAEVSRRLRALDTQLVSAVDWTEARKRILR